MEFLKNFNWVDVLLLTLAVRIVYTAGKTGFIVELLKTLGVLFTLLVVFHFYSTLAGWCPQVAFFPGQWLPALAFVVLWLAGVILCRLIREGFLLMFTVQSISLVDSWGAAALSVVRFLLIGSMLLFLFFATGVPYLHRGAQGAFVGKHILPVAPGTYSKVTRGFVAALFPAEKVNPAVAEVMAAAVKK